MSPDAHTVRVALNGAMEARALGDAEARRLYNPDSEVNSLAERLLQLRAYGVPETALRMIFDDLKVVIRLNGAQTEQDAAVSGQLDELATALHRAATEQHVQRALGIQALARALRPALQVIQRPADSAPAAFVAAVRTVDRIVAQTPRARLCGSTLRHELGAGKHDLLRTLVEAAGSPA